MILLRCQSPSPWKTLMLLIYVLLLQHYAASSSAASDHNNNLNNGVKTKKSKDKESNKFRDHTATDDMLPYPHLDEDALLNSKCPKQLELRWQTEVSSSIFATPLIADINSDGRLEVVVPSFVHYLEVLEGSDGDKLPGYLYSFFHPAIYFHFSLVISIVCSQHYSLF